MQTVIDKQETHPIIMGDDGYPLLIPAYHARGRISEKSRSGDVATGIICYAVQVVDAGLTVHWARCGITSSPYFCGGTEVFNGQNSSYSINRYGGHRHEWFRVGADASSGGDGLAKFPRYRHLWQVPEGMSRSDVRRVLCQSVGHAILTEAATGNKNGIIARDRTGGDLETFLHYSTALSKWASDNRRRTKQLAFGKGGDAYSFISSEERVARSLLYYSLPYNRPRTLEAVEYNNANSANRVRILVSNTSAEMHNVTTSRGDAPEHTRMGQAMDAGLGNTLSWAHM